MPKWSCCRVPATRRRKCRNRLFPVSTSNASRVSPGESRFGPVSERCSVAPGLVRGAKTRGRRFLSPRLGAAFAPPRSIDCADCSPRLCHRRRRRPRGCSDWCRSVCRRESRPEGRPWGSSTPPGSAGTGFPAAPSPAQCRFPRVVPPCRPTRPGRLPSRASGRGGWKRCCRRTRSSPSLFLVACGAGLSPGPPTSAPETVSSASYRGPRGA
mmetsp:Transcript_27320/g.63993  ORF Transcript_27320/g.63993 Transcript_27320/m.63993 type:complete len:212 (-) Transcript_27320:111-746(-)